MKGTEVHFVFSLCPSPPPPPFHSNRQDLGSQQLVLLGQMSCPISKANISPQPSSHPPPPLNTEHKFLGLLCPYGILQKVFRIKCAKQMIIK
ncbi:hypothetical protein ACTXT7_016706 [Hymenolepis weldensis]